MRKPILINAIAEQNTTRLACTLTFCKGRLKRAAMKRQPDHRYIIDP